jgi:beta-N-acetylhexosaminidase
MKLLKTTVVKSIAISILGILLFQGATSLPQRTDPGASEYKIESPDQSWVEKTLAGLTLREKIGQLIQVRVRGEFLNRQSPAFQELIEEIHQCRIGGVVLFTGNIYESAILLNELQSSSTLPLLVSADFERGASFRIADTTSFPWTMAIGATGSEEFAYQEGKITAQEARALGVHWIFAPVLDVNNNPDNPVINIRSFGEDPRLVARLGSAFIRGARAGGALTTAKHFPGHGDTATDTHIGLAVVPSDLERLNSVELVPFKSAIEMSVDAIMTAHVAVPKVTGEPEIPATLSSAILTDLLRNTLQFKGIVVTDAMEMGGITNKYWCGLAAVRAITAGSDTVLLPTDANVAINEIERAVNRGDIPLERIDSSAKKVLEAKSSLGLHKNRTVPVDRIGDSIATPQNAALAQDIANHSITAVKDEHHLLPVNPVNDPEIFSLVLDSGLDTSPGSVFQSEMRTIYPSLRTDWANARITQEEINDIQKSAAGSDIIVCSTFARLTSGRNTIAIPRDQQTIIEKLIATGKPMIWIAFGNPYVLERFPKVGTYLCTFSYSDVSQRAAAKAITGAIPVMGKMPVSIPKLASVGDGLQLPKLELVLKPALAETTDTSSDTFKNARKILNSFTSSGLISKAQLLVGHQGSIVLDLKINIKGYIWGSSDRFGVIMSAMLATESGSLLLDAPVQDYLPEYRNTDLGKVTISDLLVNISGMSSILPEKEIPNISLIAEIGSRASGLPIYRIHREQLFNTLGMAQLGYIGNGEDLRLFEDKAEVSQMLLNKGIYKHCRIFKPATIALFTAPGNNGKALGWMKPNKADWTGRLFSPEAFGYMGIYDGFLWIDPQKQLFIILSTSEREKTKEAEIFKVFEKITQSIMDEIIKD